MDAVRVKELEQISAEWEKKTTQEKIIAWINYGDDLSLFLSEDQQMALVEKYNGEQEIVWSSIPMGKSDKGNLIDGDGESLYEVVRVPGGWLVSQQAYEAGDYAGMTTTFVPQT